MSSKKYLTLDEIKPGEGGFYIELPDDNLEKEWNLQPSKATDNKSLLSQLCEVLGWPDGSVREVVEKIKELKEGHDKLCEVVSSPMPMNLKPVPSRLEIAKDIFCSMVNGKQLRDICMEPFVDVSWAYADALISKEKATR